MPFLPDRYLSELRAVHFGTALQVVEEATSSIDVAWEWLREGGPEGGLVVVRRQTRGRGKLHRPWVSPEGGLWMSVLARPRVPAEAVGRLGIAMALAAVEAVGAIAPDVTVKWPNDLLLAGRKLAGVLVETELRGGEVAGAVLSLGMNVNLSRVDLPEELRATATTLREVTGREHSLETLAARTLEALERLWPAVLGDGGLLCAAWRDRDALWGAKVAVEVGEEIVRGEARGIDASGALLLLSKAQVRRVQAGEVSSLGSV